MLPEVPTFIEAAQPRYDMSYWWGIAAPAGTPTQIIERLMAAYGFSRRKAYMVDDEAIDKFCKSRVGFAKDQGTIEHPPTKAEDAHDE